MADCARIAVVGAGVMGSGIAQKYAASGYVVSLIDTKKAALDKSKEGIKAMLSEGVLRGKISADEADTTLLRLLFSDNLNDAKTAELVIEAIFEDKAQKVALFRNLEEVCLPDAILATNTSSLKVADLQGALKHQERFLGLHYFFHPAKNRLVELIGTDATASFALAKARLWQERIKKVVIVSKDSPGFIVNRFFVPWLNEALRIVAEGSANIATVEEAAKQVFKIGMGPFTLMNVTGMPITYHACTAMAEYMGPFYAPSPMLLQQINSGQLWDIKGVVDASLIKPIGMRLMAVVVAISSQLVLVEKVCTSQDVDMGAKVGLLWEKGPFELLQEHKEALNHVGVNSSLLGEGAFDTLMR